MSQLSSVSHSAFKHLFIQLCIYFGPQFIEKMPHVKTNLVGDGRFFLGKLVPSVHHRGSPSSTIQTTSVRWGYGRRNNDLDACKSSPGLGAIQTLHITVSYKCRSIHHVKRNFQWSVDNSCCFLTSFCICIWKQYYK